MSSTKWMCEKPYEVIDCFDVDKTKVIVTILIPKENASRKIILSDHIQVISKHVINDEMYKKLLDVVGGRNIFEFENISTQYKNVEFLKSFVSYLFKLIGDTPAQFKLSMSIDHRKKIYNFDIIGKLAGKITIYCTLFGDMFAIVM